VKKAVVDVIPTIIIFVTIFCFLSCQLRDSSDGPHDRSGLIPHTDAFTGCQYLSKPLGGITPRMDANGRQVGCRR
jgi:hypothetical protein